MGKHNRQQRSNLDTLADQVAGQLQEPPEADTLESLEAEMPEDATKVPVPAEIEANTDASPVSASAAVDQTELILSDTNTRPPDNNDPGSPASPAPVIPSTPQSISADSVLDSISALSPAQLAKLRLKLQSTDAVRDHIPKPLPDGRIQFTIALGPEVVEPLKIWAEAAGCSLEEEIQQIAEVALSGYVYQDWGGATVTQQTTTVAAPAASTPPPAPVTVAA
jgi:hypothetical protein